MRTVSFFILLLAGCAAPPASESLAGTSWRLVRFEGGDGKVRTPDEPAAYTVAFAADGAVSVRFDCNRGRGTWKSAQRNQVEFGPLALTRAMCPPGSLHDQLVQDWPLVRSYVLTHTGPFLDLKTSRNVYSFRALPAP